MGDNAGARALAPGTAGVECGPRGLPSRPRETQALLTRGPQRFRGPKSGPSTLPPTATVRAHGLQGWAPRGRRGFPRPELALPPAHARPPTPGARTPSPGGGRGGPARPPTRPRRDYEARRPPLRARGACRELWCGRRGERARRACAPAARGLRRPAGRARRRPPRPSSLPPPPARRPPPAPAPRRAALSPRPPAATDVYGEALGVLQVAEDPVGRQRDALVQAVPAAPAAARPALRHFGCARPASSAMEIYAHIFDC